MKTLALALGLTLSLACGGGDEGNQTPDAGPGGDGGAADAAMLIDAAPPVGDNIVPSIAADLNVYLQASTYDQFAAEANIHPTAGPHLTMVRSFFNSTLDQSLRGGSVDHPIGSAVVKELYNGGGGLGGWAVMVKVTNGAQTPANDWYFYEVLSTTPGAAPVLEGNGISGCADCHSAGPDFIRTNYP